MYEILPIIMIGKQTLIFCSSKKGTESLSKLLLSKMVTHMWQLLERFIRDIVFQFNFWLWFCSIFFVFGAIFMNITWIVAYLCPSIMNCQLHIKHQTWLCFPFRDLKGKGLYRQRRSNPSKTSYSET